MLLFVALIIIIILVWLIIRQIHENFLSQDDTIIRLKAKLLPIFPELLSTKLMRGTSSYTINKHKIFICLKDKQTKQIYDDNMLVYVILHELAHVMCDEIGHTEKFQKIFNNLLLRAVRNGLWDPTIPRIENYCK
jgi:Zn-dependent peptidase ImmA (M78 family)